MSSQFTSTDGAWSLGGDRVLDSPIGWDLDELVALWGAARDPSGPVVSVTTAVHHDAFTGYMHEGIPDAPLRLSTTGEPWVAAR
ncbi:hypothetical protein [Nocardia nova]|uniref:hypothetical protein n=1 Tax=Nocardia nova TaxID=37330 RepID=UPI00340DEDB9